VPAGKLGGVGLALLAAGLASVALLHDHAAWWDIVWRMGLCGTGFALFQSPNNRLMIASTPRERSGAGSGMLSTARLLGQTTGAAMVALVFGVFASAGIGTGAQSAIALGAGFAVVATAVSLLRLRV